MSGHALSRTALWVAAARAIGAREPDAMVRNPDVLAADLLGDPAQLPLRHPVIDGLSLPYHEAMENLETVGLVRAMTVRTRFIGEALERAVGDGATQLLILGAGLDSHALRYRELLAGVRVFELDRPATLAFKQQRVQVVVGPAPANICWVALDLDDDLASVLQDRGYDPAQRTFVIMEGVSMYLSGETLLATLRFIAGHAPGTRIVFDFATRAMIDGLKRLDLRQLPEAARPSFERFIELIRDEPWLTGLPLDGEAALLEELGLQLVEMLTIGGEQSVKRYLTRADGSSMGGAAQQRAEAMRRAASESAIARVDASLREKVLEQMREQERQMAYRIAVAGVPAR